MNSIYLFPLIAGICVCLQGTINGHWQSKVGVHLTVLVNGLIVTLLTAAFFFLGNETPMQRITSEVKPWIAVNGLCGFIMLTIAALTFPRIGAASVIVLMILGQLLTSVLVDHYGFLDIPRHPVTLLRIGGIALVFLGVILTTRY